MGAYDNHVVGIVEHWRLRLGSDDDCAAPDLITATGEYDGVADWEDTEPFGGVLVSACDQEALTVLLEGIHVASFSLAEKGVGRVVVLELRLGHGR